jgi:hypothetical protein
MSTYFNNFTNIISASNISTSDYIIGYKTASSGGERRTTTDTIAQYISTTTTTIPNSAINSSVLIGPQANNFSMNGNAIKNSPTTAKAWVVFNGNAGSNTSVIKKSYNVISVTWQAKGRYMVTFTNSLNDKYYSYGLSSIGQNNYGVTVLGAYNTEPTVKIESQVEIYFYPGGYTYTDPHGAVTVTNYDTTEVSLIAFGN